MQTDFTYMRFGLLCYSIPHFMCIFLLYKLFFSSGISKTEGRSPNGMSSKQIICMAGCLIKNQNQTPCAFAGWDLLTHALRKERRGTYGYLRPLQAVGPDTWAWVSMTTGTPPPRGGFRYPQGLGEAASTWTEVCNFVIQSNLWGQNQVSGNSYQLFNFQKFYFKTYFQECVMS